MSEAPAGQAPRPQTVDAFIDAWQSALGRSTSPTVELSTASSQSGQCGVPTLA